MLNTAGTLMVLLCYAVYGVREIMFMHERRQWQNERKDLYSRIQAGSLQEYQQATRKPSPSVVKDREQRVSELTKEKGITRKDLQYPAHWKP